MPTPKHVLICTPCYGGLVTDTYMNSILNVFFNPRDDVAVGVYTATDSDIGRVRCNMMATFLDNPVYTHLFWIDADIGFDPDQFYRILDADRDVVAGAYPFKRHFEPNNSNLDAADPAMRDAARLRYVINLKDTEAAVPEDGFAEVLDAGTGFMCISRGALEWMKEAYPELAFTTDMHGVKGSENHLALFYGMVEDGRLLSEDYAFCRRWQKLGGQIWLDVHSRLTHVGSYSFHGNLPLTLSASSFVRPQPRLETIEVSRDQLRKFLEEAEASDK